MRRHSYFWIFLLIIIVLACSGSEDPKHIDPERVKASDLSGEKFFFSYMCGFDLSGKNLQDVTFS
jgi:hypothetical protein